MMALRQGKTPLSGLCLKDKSKSSSKCLAFMYESTYKEEVHMKIQELIWATVFTSHLTELAVYLFLYFCNITCNIFRASLVMDLE